MTYKPTNFQEHIGGKWYKWYVGDSEQFQNVDVRRWFIGVDNIIRPTTSGISLSFAQWSNLKKVVEQMNDQFPQFTTILPCLHDSQRQIEMCSECHPNHIHFSERTIAADIIINAAVKMNIINFIVVLLLLCVFSNGTFISSIVVCLVFVIVATLLSMILLIQRGVCCSY